MKLNFFALGSLLAPVFAASLSSGATSIAISDRRITGTGGVFAAGTVVTANDVGMGGMIVADGDGELLSDIKTAWANAAGSSSGIYYELQEVAFIVYPGQSKELPTSATFAIYLPPMNQG